MPPTPLASKLSSPAPPLRSNLGFRLPVTNYPSYIALQSDTADFVLKQLSVPSFLPILDQPFLRAVNTFRCQEAAPEILRLRWTLVYRVYANSLNHPVCIPALFPVNAPPELGHSCTFLTVLRNCRNTGFLIIPFLLLAVRRLSPRLMEYRERPAKNVLHSPRDTLKW